MYKLSIIVILCLFATVGKSQNAPAQEPIKVVEAFLSKVEKSKTISHSSDQVWSRIDGFGLEDNTHHKGDSKFMIVPDDTIGAYYSFHATHRSLSYKNKKPVVLPAIIMAFPCQRLTTMIAQSKPQT